MQCPGCGIDNAQQSRFCPSCGTRLAVHGEERRVVTVLFADLVGFTSIAEHRDPEQVKHLVDRCFGWLVEDIVSFGGRVDKIIGDGILALFGAPIAHEDDAERAVRAALRMQHTVESRSEELDGIVRLRIGVNTGEVLVGALHAGGDYTAMGDVVNSASRLQSAAEPGQVLVGDATRQATRQVIDYLAKGELEVKGRVEALRVWQASAPLTIPGERPNRSTGAIVGRDAEVAALAHVADTALSHGRASLLVVLGDAGMGKSRISLEVVQRLAGSSDPLVLQGRCVPYGEVNAWWPVAEAVRGAMGVDPNAGFAEIHDELVAEVADAMGTDPGDPDVVRTIAGLTQLFGIEETGQDLDPDHSREEIVRAVVTYLDATAARRPVVMRLSDMHWADPVVLGMLDTVMTRLARRPVVILATARRSLLRRWSPPIGRFDTFALNLEALDTAATDELIDRLITDEGGEPLDEVTRAELRERSGGNPLFLVELMALLQERDAPTSAGADLLEHMPGTLRGLIAARLDNLAPAERAVLDDASVLGRRGLVGYLAEMAAVRGVDAVDDAIAELAARDLFKVEGESWAFRSDLTREVAYHMLTKSDRADKHLGIARWIERHHTGPWLDRSVDLLAHHYGQAAELLADLGSAGQVGRDVRDRALHWITEVSSRGERLRLVDAVERLCTQGLALADEGHPEIRLKLLLRRARIRVLARDAPGARADADAARELAESLEHASGLAAVLIIEGDLAQLAGDLHQAAVILDRAVARYEAAGDANGRAEALRARGMVELFAGRTARAEQTTGAARDAFRALGRRTGEAWALQNLAWMAFAQGRVADAEARIAESLAIFDELHDAAGRSWARGLLGFVRLQEGALAEAAELQRSVLADSRAGGDRWATAMMLLLGSVVELWSGRTEESLAAGREGIELFRAVHDRYGEVRMAWPLTRALVMRGEAAEAFEVLAEVEGSLEGDDAVDVDRAQLALARATAEVHLGQVEDAQEALDDLLALAVGSVVPHASATTGGAPAADGALAVDGSTTSDDAERPNLVDVANLPGGVEGCTLMGTARLQAGDVAGAAAAFALARDAAAGTPAEVAVAAASAFGELARGNTDGVAAAVAIVARSAHATYADRVLVGLAQGLAAARDGDASAASRAFARARGVAADTGDRLTAALAQLAEGIATDHLDGDRTGEARARALAGLRGLGTDAHGWQHVFERCVTA